ncbi:unnamed protein product [Lactuca virosa]|uniref:Uncharacterized protein n=1 Tax=Lactuca virosa TaxID=75947 RepID=A0AAU9LTF5_9ASTR|nr:unnamed protein product [Lactuca virosa]
METSTLDTSISLPTFSSHIPYSLPVSTISPTYSTIMHEPITTLFYSQSIEVERIVQDDEPNDDDIMISFADLQFDLEEYNIPDNMIMLGKQFKILNNKLNSLLLIQAHTGGRNVIFGVEIEYMLKSQENRLRSLVENIEKQQVERLEDHANHLNTRFKIFVMLLWSVMNFLLSK